MDPNHWKQLERIFAEAIELPESERADFLDRACGSNVEMRGEVESLIARAHGDGESLQRAVLRAAKAADANNWVEHKIGTWVSNYRIGHLLGRGGTGTVYLAYDARLHRRVALKMMTSSTEAETSRALLLREARNAAVLNHSNICTIY